MRASSLAASAAAFVGVVACGATPADPDCKYPGTCTPPDAATYTYQKVAPLVPRKQWGRSGGYCGSLSIQEIALTYGAWFSQATIRQQAEDGGGHGDPEDGYEVLHTNIEGALQKLGLSYEAFPWQTTPYPQSIAYLPWLKTSLAAGAPVVWFVMCAGDSHDTYGIGAYDHIEAVFGLYSANPLDAPLAGSDVLVHTSDYAPDGADNAGYFRRFDTLTDTPAFDGNCSNAIPEYGHNEMYPCLSFNESYGYAITGFAQGPTMQLSMTVDSLDEPDTGAGEAPSSMTATLTVSGVEDGRLYDLYRFDRGNFVVPEDSEDYPGTADWVLQFAGGISTTSSVFVWSDSHPIASNMSVAYRAVNVGSIPHFEEEEQGRLSHREEALAKELAPELLKWRALKH